LHLAGSEADVKSVKEKIERLFANI